MIGVDSFSLLQVILPIFLIIFSGNNLGLSDPVIIAVKEVPAKGNEELILNIHHCVFVFNSMILDEVDEANDEKLDNEDNDYPCSKTQAEEWDVVKVVFVSLSSCRVCGRVGRVSSSCVLGRVG